MRDFNSDEGFKVALDQSIDAATAESGRANLGAVGNHNGRRIGAKTGLELPQYRASLVGPGGPIAEGVAKVNIGFNNLEFSYFPARTKLKAGTTVTFTNVGDIPHSAP